MAEKLEFRKKLGQILAFAEEKGGRITLEEAEQFFEEDVLSEEQMDLVCDYLLAQKITVPGYHKQPGTVREAKEEQEADELSSEEQEYLEDYLQDLEYMRGTDGSKSRLAYYLPLVVEAALKMHHRDVFLGDMVQEGNLRLMTVLDSAQEENESDIMEDVKSAMAALAESQTEIRRQDKRMVNQVAELDETIRNMTEDLGRKVSVDEVADKTQMTEEQISDIMKLAGEDIEEDQ